MIYIRKNAEPWKFREYCTKEFASFDGMDSDVKDCLRRSLLEEQGYICAYCMKRIRDIDEVKIEHLVARTPENELQYSNLLAVCKGGENGPVSARSCDTKKGNRPLFLSPTCEADMSRIYYQNNGEIHSTDRTLYHYRYKSGVDKQGVDKYVEGDSSPDLDLSEALNLNYENGEAMQGRKTALRAFQKKLQPYKHESSKRKFLEKMREYYCSEMQELPPYVGILRWYIDKKLT